jgi:hypothetical protein
MHSPVPRSRGAVGPPIAFLPLFLDPVAVKPVAPTTYGPYGPDMPPYDPYYAIYAIAPFDLVRPPLIGISRNAG